MDFAHRIGSMFDLGSGSTSSRMQIWSAAWEATKDRPLLGWGADTFRQVFSIYKPFGYSETVNAISVADNAHNYPLHLMAGVGIPAMLAVYAFFLAPLVTSRWIVHNGREPPRSCTWLWGSCSRPPRVAAGRSRSWWAHA